LEDRRLLATFTVMSTADDGSSGTLRSVIAEATATPGANTIDFDATVFSAPQTITLGGSWLELSQTSGTLTITGPTAGVTISGGGQSQVLLVDTGVTASISSMTLTKGKVSGNGGAVNNAGTLSLTDCTISGSSGSGSGGGLFNTGTATLTSCMITGNNAAYGGGLNNHSGTVTLDTCTVSSNGAFSNGGGTEGGGVFNTGTAHLKSCTVTGNAGYSSGGVRNTGTVDLTSCTLDSNSAKYYGGLGNFGTATLTDCTVSSNTAWLDDGGLVNTGTLGLTDCLVTNNGAGIAGGGVGSGGTATLNDCTISGNSAQHDGGVLLGGKAYLTSCTISDNKATSSRGGGVTSGGTLANLTDCTITGNSAVTNGGGLYVNATTSLTACTINNNSANNGGGLYNKSGTTLTDTIVAGNTLTNSSIASDIQGSNVSGGHNLIGPGGAGGLQNNVNGNIVLGDLSHLGLAPLASYGGPTETMALLPGSMAIHTGTTVSGVTTDQRGEPVDSPPDIGAFQTQATLRVNDATDETVSPFSELSLREAVGLANLANTAQAITFDPSVQSIALKQGQLELSDTGGTLTISGSPAGVVITGAGQSRVFQIDGGVTAVFSGMTITGGSAAGNGGGLSNSGTLTLSACAIAGNTATNAGGGLDDAGTASLVNCTISGNSANDGGGLAIEGAATLTDCTISGNSAGTSAGGLSNTGTALLLDTIVAGNTGPGSSPSDVGGSVNGSSSNNLIGAGGSGGISNGSNGNIVLPPSLVGLDLAPLGSFGGPTETIALLPGSAAIGAGVGLSGTSTDERGAARPTSGATDIGAFQDLGYTLAVSSGNTQTTLVGENFQAPLAAVLTEGFAQSPLPGVTVDFSTPSTGASATLSASSLVTGATGVVSVAATANVTAGTYVVSALASGVPSSASFNLTNQIQPGFSGLTSQTVSYGSTVTIAGTLAAGQQAPAGESVTITVGGVTHHATTAADGSFSTQFTHASGVLSANPSAYEVVYEYPSDGVFLAASAFSNLTVTPEPLTITATANAKTYDATTSASAVPIITSGSLATGDMAEFSESYSTVGAGMGLTLTPSGTVKDGNGGNNYTYTFVPIATGVIAPAPLTVTATSSSMTYGGTVPILSYTFTGLVKGDTTASFTGNPGTSATSSSSVGPYPIRVGSLAATGNYTIGTFNQGTLTVAPAPLTVTAQSNSMAYGGTVPALSYSYTGLFNGDMGASFTGSLSTTATSSNNIGPYPITVGSLAATGNYTIGAFNPATFTVNPAPLTVTAQNNNMSYGGTVPALSYGYTGLVNGDASASFTGSLSTTATSSSSVGSYPITAGSLAATGNYMIGTFNHTTLIVNPAPLTVTAQNNSMTYGGAVPALSYIYTGLVNGDTGASLTGSPNTTATSSSNVGPYPITIGSLAATGNYMIGTFNQAPLTVNPAPLTVTAQNNSMTYGGAVPALSYMYTGLVNGDTGAPFTGSASTTATSSSSVGPYPITIGSLAATGNYTIGAFNPAALTVNPAQLVITAESTTKTYGQTITFADTAFTVLGLLNSDTVSSVTLTSAGGAATAAVPGSPYAVVPSAAVGSGLSNYSIRYVNGKFTVNPAPLTITANNASKVYGEANPKFSASYSGFVNGDTSSSLITQPNFSTAARTTSPAGSYPIKVSGAVDPDYTITYVEGTLTVNPPLATVKSVEVEDLKSGRKTTEVIVVQFSEALKSAAAQNINDYSLVTVPTSSKQRGKPVSLASASYNAKAFTVTLTTSKALVLSPPVDLTIAAARVLDSLGRPLAANYSATLKKVGVPVTPTAAIVRTRALSPEAVDAALSAWKKGT
jgi:hypothetical protein